MLLPASQLVLAHERRYSVYDGFNQVVVAAWEPARRRTILRRGTPVSIDAPALLFGYFYRRYTDATSYNEFGGRQFYTVVVATRAGPDEALDAPAHSLRLPHVAGGGSVCIGHALAAVLRGRLAPDEAFWCTDFVDGNMRRRSLVGAPRGATPRQLLGLRG
jgi:hypothetical protein